MGILDDYLNSGTNKAAPSAAEVSRSSLINSYMNNTEAPPTVKNGKPFVTPSGDIEYISEEDIKKASKASSEAGSGRRSLTDVAVRAGVKGYEAAKEGALTAGTGIGETLSGKPASGVGKMGTGLLSVAGSPFEAITSAGADLTGSEVIGSKASMLVGGVPVGKVSRATVARIPGVTNLPVLRNLKGGSKDRSLRDLVSDITDEGRNPQALVDTINAMKADTRIGPADTSPAVLSNAQKLFVREGAETKNYLYNTSKSRLENLPEDVRNAFDVAGGAPVNVIEKLQALSNAQKKAGTDLINPALASAKPVNINNTLTEIDNVLKPGVLKIGDSVPLTAVKKELEDIRKSLRVSKEYDAKDLHTFQSGLRRTAESLMRGNGESREVGNAIMKVRNNLVNDIEASAKGYKEGLAKYREESHIADSFRDGYNGVFSTSTKMENRPEFTEKWFNSLTDAEKEAAREGARLAIDSKMGASGNASLAGTRLAQSDFNRQKLEILFGKEETDKLLRNLENTRSIKNTDQKIIEGSQTAARISGEVKSEIPVQGQSKNNLINYALPFVAEYSAPGVGGAIGTGLIAAKAVGSKIKHEIQVKLAKERNLNYAKMAMPVEGPSRDQLIKELETFIPQPKQSLLSRIARKMPVAP